MIKYIEINPKKCSEDIFEEGAKLLYKNKIYHSKLTNKKLVPFKKFLKTLKEKDTDTINNKWFCVLVNGELKGILSAVLFGSNKKINGGQIIELYVEEEYRNKNYATEITKNAIKWIKTNTKKNIYVNIIWENKNILKFYQKLGFDPTGIYLKLKI